MTIESWEEARAVLKERLAALNAEIGSYPGPITGCDEQFNHMLEERTQLNAELSRLDGSKAAGGNALARFKESCPFLAG